MRVQAPITSGTSARRRGWVQVALVVCVALVCACGDDSSPTAPSPTPEPTANLAPTVSIQTMPQTVDGGATLMLQATSADADGTIESYAWSGSGSFSDTAIANPAWTAPTATASDQAIVLTLTVTDDAGARASASVTITVRAATRPPPNSFTLSGQVTDRRGQRVGGVTIRVLDGPHEGASVNTGADGRYSLPNLTGNFFVSAMKSGYVARRAGAGPMQTMLDFVLTDTDIADYIEALFLGLGPLSPGGEYAGCPDGEYGHWIGWEQNIRLRITVSDVVDSAAMRLVEMAVTQLSEATAGRYFATYSRTDAPNPLPGLHEVTLTEHPDPVSQGCPLPRGCTIFTFTGHQTARGAISQFHSSGTSVLRGARAILQTTYLPPQGHLHDAIGHGALGLCHIDERRNGGTQNSLMSGGPTARGADLPDRLTQRDLDAINAVFSSDLAVGARRADFVREGMVNP